MKCYVLHVRSGKELQIAEKLNELNIFAFVPIEKMQIRRGGKWNEVEKIIIPGYVFVKIKSLTMDKYYKIRQVQNVIRFLGGGKPILLADDETKFIEMLYNDGKPLEQIVVSNINKMLPAPLRDVKDIKILKIDSRQRRARISLTLFGITHIITVGAV